MNFLQSSDIPLYLLLGACGFLLLFFAATARDERARAVSAKSKKTGFLGGTAAVLIVLYGLWAYGADLSAALAPLVGAPPTPQSIAVLSLFGAVIMTAIAGLPILAFISRGWTIKYADVMSSLSPDAITLYVSTFMSNERRAMVKGQQENDTAIFSRVYIRRYGRYRLREPLMLLMVTLFPLALLVSHTALARLLATAHLHYAQPSLILPDEALAAITGAYAFVIASLVRAAFTYNLPPLVLVNAALRLLVAAPLGYAVASWGGGKSDFIAFAIGAFPLDQAQTIIRRLTSNYFNTTAGNTDDTPDAAIALDGVGQTISESLANGEITTAAQLAYCDPVQVSLRTNIAFDAIVDLQSEALAYIFLGDTLSALRGQGLRGAVQISNFMAREQPDPKSDFAVEFLAAQAASKMDLGGLRNGFRTISCDPYTKFLVAVSACRG